MPSRRARPATSSAPTIDSMPARTARMTRGTRTAAGVHPAAEPLHRGALHLIRLLRREDDASGLSPARLSALAVLVFGGPTSLGALAAAEGVSAPTMSRLVTELERGRWIRRRPDPADARATRLEATVAARRLLLAGRARRLDALSAALDGVSDADRAALERAVPALERLVHRLTTGAPTATPRTARRRRRFD